MNQETCKNCKNVKPLSDKCGRCMEKSQTEKWAYFYFVNLMSRLIYVNYMRRRNNLNYMQGGKSMEVTNLEITDKFQIVGTVGKVESMETKGGGWQFKVVCNDNDAIQNLAIARGKVCVFDVGVSVNGHGQDSADQGEFEYNEDADEMDDEELDTDMN
jgi:hypothetical protein